ncbi:MAG: GNAT family N-acetyltransferase [Candidatus Angelobacter sp.]
MKTMLAAWDGRRAAHAFSNQGSASGPPRLEAIVASSAADQDNGSMFRRSKASSGKAAPQQVTSGRFEIERQGHVAYLEYTLAGKILQLIHSEVPEGLRGQGLGSELAHSALEWAREQGLKVDVVCPSVAEYLRKHPGYSDLVL